MRDPADFSLPQENLDSGSFSSSFLPQKLVKIAASAVVLGHIAND